MKKHIKRISILLTVLMILSAFPMVSAYEYVSPDNVTYLDASFATVGTENWYAWTWSDNSNGRWVQGTEVSYRVYSFNYLDNNVLFARVDKTKQADWNNGSVYNQTEDLVNHTADYYYVITAWNSSSSDKMQGKWEFVGPDKPPTDPTEVYYTVEPPTTDPVTEPSTDNAHDSLYNTYQRIRDSIPVGGTPYTKESQQRFNAALRAAEDLLDDATATDTQLREAEQELKDAYNSLEYSTADRTKLWTAIEKLRTIIESGEYKNYSNADELKEIYDYALPVVYYEPDQSVIDEWEAKIYAALQKAGVITEPTTEPNYTEPYTTGYTEPTATTEDPTGHCTEFDLPYSPDFAVALANYTNNLMGESLSVSDIDLFHYDQTTVVFGLSDNLCTEGHENIDGYHFENWNFFPHEANKTGYCVYYNGTIYNLPDAVSNSIMTASALASIIPHSSKLEGSTQPTETTESSQPIITEPTDPTATTEDPTGHCTDWEQEQLKMQFATELSSYSYELGYNEPISINEITPYTEDYRMYVFALTDNLCTESEEIINGYKFTNPNFFGNEKNKTGYCVFNGTKIYSIADAVKERIVTVVDSGERHGPCVRGTQLWVQTCHVSNAVVNTRHVGDLLGIDTLCGTCPSCAQPLLPGDNDFPELTGIFFHVCIIDTTLTQVQVNIIKCFILITNIRDRDRIRTTYTHTLNGVTPLIIGYRIITRTRRLVNGSDGSANDIFATSCNLTINA